MSFDFERGTRHDPKEAARQLLDTWHMKLIIENGHEAADRLRQYVRTRLPPSHPLMGFKDGPGEPSTRYEIEVSERAEHVRVYIQQADRLIDRANTAATTIDVTAESVNEERVRRQVFITAETARTIAHQAERCKSKLVPLLAKMEEVLSEWREWHGPDRDSDDLAPGQRPLIDRFDATSGLKIALSYLMRRQSMTPPPPPQPVGFGGVFGSPITSWKGPMVALDGRGSGRAAPRMW